MLLSGLLAVLLLLDCGTLDGLEPVTGMTGRIEFQGEWPDSLTAAALVILDPVAALDQAHIGNYLITYSQPDTVDNEYFIVLPAGGYMGVVVGLTVDPGQFAVNVDEYLSQPQLPIVMLTDPTETGLVQVVPKDGVLELDWEVSFE